MMTSTVWHAALQMVHCLSVHLCLHLHLCPAHFEDTQQLSQVGANWRAVTSSYHDWPTAVCQWQVNLSAIRPPKDITQRSYSKVCRDQMVLCKTQGWVGQALAPQPMGSNCIVFLRQDTVLLLCLSFTLLFLHECLQGLLQYLPTLIVFFCQILTGH